jgi:hypothetical protein
VEGILYCCREKLGGSVTEAKLVNGDAGRQEVLAGSYQGMLYTYDSLKVPENIGHPGASSKSLLARSNSRAGSVFAGAVCSPKSLSGKLVPFGKGEHMEYFVTKCRSAL